MKVLITGGCGFIGTNLTIKACELGWDVTVIDRDVSRLGNWQSSARAARIVHADYSDEESLKLVRKMKYDAILHQAAIPRVSYSVEHPVETSEENIIKTIQLLEAAAGNCRRFVFASSSAIYGDTEKLPITEDMSIGSRPQSPYALQKQVCENYISLFCSQYGLDAISLRYFNVFGPHQYGDSPYATALSSWCHRIKSGEKLRSDGDGLQSRDLCYVDNVVEANILAALKTEQCSGEAMNIACGDRISNKEILDALAVKHSFNIESAPFRKGDIMHTQADIALAKSILGYEPVVAFWEGFERTLKWWDL